MTIYWCSKIFRSCCGHHFTASLYETSTVKQMSRKKNILQGCSGGGGGVGMVWWYCSMSIVLPYWRHVRTGQSISALTTNKRFAHGHQTLDFEQSSQLYMTRWLHAKRKTIDFCFQLLKIWFTVATEYIWWIVSTIVGWKLLCVLLSPRMNWSFDEWMNWRVDIEMNDNMRKRL